MASQEVSHLDYKQHSANASVVAASSVNDSMSAASFNGDDRPVVGRSRLVSKDQPTGEKKKQVRLPDGALTDPNSIYRKLYNRSLEFFLWVIDKEPAPYVFKLHVQAETQKEIKVNTVRRSVQALIPRSQNNKKPAKVQAQFFVKKK